MNISTLFPSNQKEDEAALISRCQAEDPASQKELFDRYREKVYRIAYGVVRHREDALDIAQEVFVKLFRSIREFRGQSKFYTYLYRMAMNTAIDWSRKAKKVHSRSFDQEDGFQLADGEEKRQDQAVIRKELASHLKAALDRLPADQKRVIILREIEGLTYQEMAETTGCSIGTVMSRLHYSRKKMQEYLKDYVKEGGWK